MATTPSGRRAIFSCYDGTLKVCDPEDGTLISTIEVWRGIWGEGNPLTVNGRNAIHMAAPDPLDADQIRGCMAWNPNTGSLDTLIRTNHELTAKATSPDGQLAALAFDDRSLQLWDLQQNRLMATYYADAVITAAYVVCQSKLVVAGDAVGRVHMLHIENCSTSSIS